MDIRQNGTSKQHLEYFLTGEIDELKTSLLDLIKQKKETFK